MALPHRMIGSPLDIDPAPAHSAALEESRDERRMYERSDIVDGPHHVLVGERQEGKTHLALRWLLEAPEGVERVLVLPTEQMAEHVRHEAHIPRSDPRIISARRLRTGGARRGVEYGIDEAVEILTQALGLYEPPRLITVCTATDWQQ